MPNRRFWLQFAPRSSHLENWKYFPSFTRLARVTMVRIFWGTCVRDRCRVLVPPGVRLLGVPAHDAQLIAAICGRTHLAPSTRDHNHHNHHNNHNNKVFVLESAPFCVSPFVHGP